jgi:hypothetical protein
MLKFLQSIRSSYSGSIEQQASQLAPSQRVTLANELSPDHHEIQATITELSALLDVARTKEKKLQEQEEFIGLRVDSYRRRLYPDEGDSSDGSNDENDENDGEEEEDDIERSSADRDNDNTTTISSPSSIRREAEGGEEERAALESVIAIHKSIQLSLGQVRYNIIRLTQQEKEIREREGELGTFLETCDELEPSSMKANNAV